MNISDQEFKYLVEGITSDLVQLLMDREQYTLAHAVEAVYGSNIYRALSGWLSTISLASSMSFMSRLLHPRRSPVRSKRNSFFILQS